MAPVGSSRNTRRSSSCASIPSTNLLPPEDGADVPLPNSDATSLSWRGSECECGDGDSGTDGAVELRTVRKRWRGKILLPK